ncbi:hypothetical protein NDU88_004615 [Pleurodeles waltl]|uniref:Uncharacterized protein n=1 Tax=Pleurodeles waltl TaxID=8319 RepID=A0AAV7MY11_PLEWA|nr:hypothetical protein NDU88_004615 [Pleurodeles waltl]
MESSLLVCSRVPGKCLLSLSLALCEELCGSGEINSTTRVTLPTGPGISSEEEAVLSRGVSSSEWGQATSHTAESPIETPQSKYSVSPRYGVGDFRDTLITDGRAIKEPSPEAPFLPNPADSINSRRARASLRGRIVSLKAVDLAEGVKFPLPFMHSTALMGGDPQENSGIVAICYYLTGSLTKGIQESP